MRKPSFWPDWRFRFGLCLVYAALLVLALSGCAGSKDKIEAPVILAAERPLPDAYLTKPCSIPGLRPGQNAKLALANDRAALKTCAARHKKLGEWVLKTH